MKRYVVGFVFDPQMTKVLLLHRNKHPYKGMLNGVGGKIEVGESPEEAMKRELAEETGIKLDTADKIELLCTTTFPSNVELHAFYIVPSRYPEISNRDTEEGTLHWIATGDELLYAANPMLAGDGNIAYFLNYARILHTA